MGQNGEILWNAMALIANVPNSEGNSDRYCVPEFPHSSATFNIILGFHILTSPEVLQGALGDSTCPMQCS